MLLFSPLWGSPQDRALSPIVPIGRKVDHRVVQPDAYAKATQNLVRQVGESGRILELGEAASDRVNPPPAIAPGGPPLLIFRSLDRQARYRLGRLDLVVDDAGH